MMSRPLRVSYINGALDRSGFIVYNNVITMFK